MGKQAYKLKLPKQWSMHNIFHILLLEQNTTKKERIDKTVLELKFETGDNKEYKMEIIWENTVYANKTKGHIPGLYYFLVWKKYFKKENIWETSSVV